MVGLNPALQTVLQLSRISLGEVHRATSVNRMVSGKGFNTAKVLKRLGHEVHLLQILGGANGQRCSDACDRVGLKSLAIWVAEETRQCITMLDEHSKTATEIIEPFKVTADNLRRAIVALVAGELKSYDAMAVCGTIPEGIDPGVYGDLIDQSENAKIIVDTWQGLNANELSKSTCVKVNHLELKALENRLQGSAMQWKNVVLAITAGGGEAFLSKEGRILVRYQPPPLPNFLNPIGAGDTVTAGLAHHLLQGLTIEESYRHALAMGSASCLHSNPAEYRDVDYQEIFTQMAVVNV